MNSPFKFLDSYTKEDRKVFFGREREIEELYHRVFEEKIMLVYGVSGTGKSSLIHCGIANKFHDSDWLPINIRRDEDIVNSLANAIKKAVITPIETEIKAANQFKKSVRSLYLDHYKPILFIFDQFEELFIFGNKEEKKEFIKIVKSLTESDLQCRFMFVLREEYLAGVTEFEKVIPTFLANRVRIERMTLTNAVQVIEGPCKVFKIDLEEGFSTEMLEKLSPESAEVELTYLQVFLDKIYRLATKESQGSARYFHRGLFQQIGNVSDLLGDFLDEQIELLPKPESTLAVLKSFVSVKGTKRQMSIEEVQDYAKTLGKPIDERELQEMLQTLIQLRILRDKDQNNRYELRHDALATKIYEKITLVEKELLEIRHLIENAYANWEKRGVLFSADDLAYIAPYENRLYLSKELDGFVEKSKYALLKANKRRRTIAFAAMAILVITLSGFTWWAMSEKAKSEIEKRKALAEKYNFFAKELVATNPTQALRVVECALSLDSTNLGIIENLNRIYYDNCFYKNISRLENIIKVDISPDEEIIAAAYWDGSIVLFDLNGNEIQKFSFKQSIRTLSFSPNGEFLLIGYSSSSLNFVKDNKSTIYLVDLKGNTLIEFSYQGKGNVTLIKSLFLDNETIVASFLEGLPNNENFITIKAWNRKGILLSELKSNNKYSYELINNILIKNNSKIIDIYGNVIDQLVYDVNESILCFSPDGNYYLSLVNGIVCQKDLNGKELIKYPTIKNNPSGSYNTIFSSDSRNILSWSNKTASLWDFNGNLIYNFVGHEMDIESALFSLNGKNLITISSSEIFLWDIEHLKNNNNQTRFV